MSKTARDEAFTGRTDAPCEPEDASISDQALITATWHATELHL